MTDFLNFLLSNKACCPTLCAQLHCLYTFAHCICNLFGNAPKYKVIAKVSDHKILHPQTCNSLNPPDHLGFEKIEKKQAQQFAHCLVMMHQYICQVCSQKVTFWSFATKLDIKYFILVHHYQAQCGTKFGYKGFSDSEDIGFKFVSGCKPLLWPWSSNSNPHSSNIIDNLRSADQVRLHKFQQYRILWRNILKIQTLLSYCDLHLKVKLKATTQSFKWHSILWPTDDGYKY